MPLLSASLSCQGCMGSRSPHQPSCKLHVTRPGRHAYCCMQGRMGISEAIDAARLEEAVQIEEWGLVEGGHDIDLSDLKARPDLPAARMLCFLTAPVHPKAPS